MSPTLAQKIENLPLEKQAEVEDFVDFLAARRRINATSKPAFPQEWLEEIDREREALFRERGPIDTDSILREFRENGDR